MKESKIIELTVDGMNCNHCAAGLCKYLEKKGLEEVYVNFATKEVRFRPGAGVFSVDQVKAGIHDLGYTVLEAESPTPWWTLERKLLLAAVFTIPLVLQHLAMMLGVEALQALENPWLQLSLSLPVYLIGFFHFGKSAWKSVRHGLPNMDVLIFIGSSAAFVYSLIGLYLANPQYYFFETAAAIITLVLLGNWLEKRAVQQTTTAIDELGKLEATQALRLSPDGKITTIPQADIRLGDRLQVNEGDPIPADGRVLKGQGAVDESMLTGEGLPVAKSTGDTLIGASLLREGNLQMEVTAIGRHSVLQQIIELVKSAQEEKPEIQRLADRISAIFVPAVLSISALTLVLSYGVFEVPFGQALMNSIAVLVISCPCAMGLATPTAVMVGIGRVARQGILIKGGQTLQTLAGIRNFVFDKTGTLTTGDFRIAEAEQPQAPEFYPLLLALEKHSSHPIARSLVRILEEQNLSNGLHFTQVRELKGQGLEAWDAEQNHYQLGAYSLAEKATTADQHQLYLLKNGELLGTLDLEDDLRPEAAFTIAYLKAHGLRPVLLSGDREAKVQQVAQNLGISDYWAAQSPEEKLQRIQQLSTEAPTAMIGDGINDAPALAKATLGVSLSGASQVAIQSAQVVLLNNRLDHLPQAIDISRATLQTIRQNLFWAFAYNLIAIPIAALGFLNPMWGALFMAFSDVVVIGNSLRLRYRRIN